MQKEWNKLLLFAIAVGFKNLYTRLDEMANNLGVCTTRVVDPANPYVSLADKYSEEVRKYKKELGLG